MKIQKDGNPSWMKTSYCRATNAQQKYKLRWQMALKDHDKLQIILLLKDANRPQRGATTKRKRLLHLFLFYTVPLPSGNVAVEQDKSASATRITNEQ